MIRRMVVLTDGEAAFAALVARARNGQGAPPRPVRIVAESLTQIARRGAREAERHALEWVLERVHWHRAEAARILQVSYKTLLNKIAGCQLSPPSRQCGSGGGLPDEESPHHCPVKLE